MRQVCNLRAQRNAAKISLLQAKLGWLCMHSQGKTCKIERHAKQSPEHSKTIAERTGSAKLWGKKESLRKNIFTFDSWVRSQLVLLFRCSFFRFFRRSLLPSLPPRTDRQTSGHFLLKVKKEKSQARPGRAVRSRTRKRENSKQLRRMCLSDVNNCRIARKAKVRR